MPEGMTIPRPGSWHLCSSFVHGCSGAVAAAVTRRAWEVPQQSHPGHVPKPGAGKSLLVFQGLPCTSSTWGIPGAAP